MKLTVAFHKFSDSPKNVAVTFLYKLKKDVLCLDLARLCVVVTVTKRLSGFQKNSLDTSNDLKIGSSSPILKGEN
jgi:hypothetical protein